MKLVVILHLIRNLKTKLKAISLAIAVRDIDMYESLSHLSILVCEEPSL